MTIVIEQPQQPLQTAQHTLVSLRVNDSDAEQIHYSSAEAAAHDSFMQSCNTGTRNLRGDGRG